MEPPATSPPPFALHIADFLTQYQKPVEWIWRSLIPTSSLVVLSAFMKVGKTTMTYGLVSAIARGIPFLDLPTERGGILVLAVEENAREVANRFRAMGVGDKDHPLWVRSGHFSRTHAGYTELRDFVLENKIKLVVIDTLAAFLHMKDENDNAEMVGALQPLLDLAHNDDVTVLAIHHNGKANTRDAGKAARGASALIGAVDVALIMNQEGRGRSRIRKIETRSRLAETPETLMFEYTIDGEFKLMEVIESGSSPITVLDQIEQALYEGEPMTVYELAEKLDKPVKRIQQALSTIPEWCLRTGEGKKGKPFYYGYARKALTIGG